MNEYPVHTDQLVDKKAVDAFIEEKWEAPRRRIGQNYVPTRKIKTGIFIQSLEFYDSTAVNITGYLWQKYLLGVHDSIYPEEEELGFIFPEQVHSGNDIAPREVYRKASGPGEEVIGWYFEATLRQPFQYRSYPFDHKTVWVRLWHKDFAKNVVLVPDFDAYEATGPEDIFGIEENIVLGAWERENTFFDYHPSSYDTNFGIQDYIGQEDFPELHYNFVVRRKFENAFIIHLLPLFLVAALLFGSLLTLSNDEKQSERHGFSTSQVIGACSALFFVVLLAHIQLREQFAGSGLVYMELFYYFMYGLLVVGVANTYLFANKSAKWIVPIHYRDNLVAKASYWPLIFASMICITLFHNSS